MSLTPEQMKRLDEEVRIRIEEEKYRKCARTRFEQEMREAADQPRPAPDAQACQPDEVDGCPKAGSSRGLLVGVGLAAAFLAGLLAQGTGVPYVPGGVPDSDAAESIDQGFANTSSEPQRLTLGEIVKTAKPAVVLVHTDGPMGGGQGSGYVHSASGIVVTNYHLVRGATSAMVELSGGERVHVKHLLGYDPEADLALLQTMRALPAMLNTAEHGEVEVGDHVVAVGSPQGLSNSVNDGIVSGFRLVGDVRWIQTTAPISPASSGGPLLNDFGVVVGVNTTYLRGGQQIDSAVPSDRIARLVASAKPISFDELARSTHQVESVHQGQLVVPARNTLTLPFRVPAQGAFLTLHSWISGGSGNDLNVALYGPDGEVLPFRRVSGTIQAGLHLTPGRHTLLLDNQFSTFSSKTFSGDVWLQYWR